jgi:hypothetical protein
MLKLLHSIFGSEKQGSYPEALVKEAIERAVDGTDPWLRAVSGYKKKLRPAVIRAIDHVVALVDGLATPVPICLGNYTDDRRLKSFFISATHMEKVLAEDRAIAEFMKGPGGEAHEIFALLAMEKQERMIFGSALSGDIVVRDVAQTTVSFDAHRFLDPSGDEGETRRYLKRRAYDHLLGLALKRLANVKWEREDLERRRTLLQSKLNLLEREGWGFDQADSTEKLSVADIEKRVGEIESQLKELGGDDRMLETYLGIVADLLGRPEEHLWGRTETIFVDRMGIKQSEASDDAPELTFSELYNAEGRSQVVMLVALESKELQAG